jgi:hypothetical protein
MMSEEKNNLALEISSVKIFYKQIKNGGSA